MSPVAEHRSPVDPAEAEALDAYSRAVVAVAERLAPSVASLRVMRRTRGGQVPSGAGSAVVLTPDGFLLTSAHVVGRANARAGHVRGRARGALRGDRPGSAVGSGLAAGRRRRTRSRGARRRRAAQGRSAGGGDRQPQRPRRLGDRGRGLGSWPLAAGPDAPRLPRDRQRDSDRRRSQPGQLRRCSGGQPWTSGGDQHGGCRRGPGPGGAGQRHDPARGREPDG